MTPFRSPPKTALPLALFAVLALAACSGTPPPAQDGGQADAGSDDITPPHIVATTPAAGSTGALVAGAIA
ncbi:MAG: hypothetical protein ACYC8T_12815, partial [Myxococcaceae bacterium]